MTRVVVVCGVCGCGKSTVGERLARELDGVFVDADPALPALAKEVGADRIEIYTGPYGGAFEPDDVAREFAKVVACGKAAEAAGLGLNAGHDLTRDNLPALVKALPNLAEVSIGHAVIADALSLGMADTVRAFRRAIGDL